MTTLDHYTIDTGDLRRSPRSEVGDEAIAACATLLSPGMHTIPGFGDWRLRVQRLLRDELRVEAWANGGIDLAVTVWVARDRAALRRVLRETKAPAVDITAPACVVQFGPAILFGADWLGDFERCLAWAWLEFAP